MVPTYIVFINRTAEILCDFVRLVLHYERHSKADWIRFESKNTIDNIDKY